MFKRTVRMVGMLVGVAVAGMALVSCALGDQGSDDLQGTRWQLATLNGQSLPEGVVITAEFNDGRLSGSAGCNSYGGSYQASDNHLTLGALAMTLMACTEAEVMDAETAYVKALDQVKSYERSDDQLTLSSADETVKLVFQRQP
jgi:heat shock protein HslJ